MNKKDIIIASGNQHKIEEVKAILSPLGYYVRSMKEVGIDLDVEETGQSFEENAILKARALGKVTKEIVLADDSGLEVEILNNEPGVYSARYSGSRDMEQNIDLLLKNLANKSNRKAAFITVISLLLDGKEYFFEGRVEGEITPDKRGDKGFGYDPVFIPEGHHKTFAEMTEEEKNAISHRAIAVKKLVDFLLSF